MNNDGGPAFPVPLAKGWDGMSLRDTFAAAALQGWLSAGWSVGDEQLARACYQAADAMIKQRQSEQSSRPTPGVL